MQTHISPAVGHSGAAQVAPSMNAHAGHSGVAQVAPPMNAHVASGFGLSAMAQVAPPGNVWWAGSAPPYQPAPAMGPLQPPNSGNGAASGKGKGQRTQDASVHEGDSQSGQHHRSHRHGRSRESQVVEFVRGSSKIASQTLKNGLPLEEFASFVAESAAFVGPRSVPRDLL